MSSKPTRQARRKRATTSRRPTPASHTLRSAQVTRPSPAAFDVVLKKLAPLLETLTDDELADIPSAAKALARRRAFFSPRPPQPIEVVLARVGHEVVGALLLRRRWMERTVDASPDNWAPVESSKKMSALSGWLNEFARHLAR